MLIPKSLTIFTLCRALKIMVIVPMAATGENEYTVIEQTGGKSFKVIQFDAGEKNTKK